MAELIKIRLNVFMPEVLLMSPRSVPSAGAQFGTDAKNISTENTMKTRVKQEVVVDFIKQEVLSNCHTGIRKAKIIYPTGKIEYLSHQANTDGIKCENIEWLADSVQFIMLASASNPISPNEPSVDYKFDLTCYVDGTISIKGMHDGFPCYEIYKQVDDQNLEMVYQHDFRKTGDTPEALDGPMEYYFEKVI